MVFSKAALCYAVACLVASASADGGVAISNNKAFSAKSVEKTVNKYKCQKPVELIEFGKDAEKTKCNFKELEVTAATLQLVIEGRHTLGVNVTVDGVVLTENFNGGWELHLSHDDSGATYAYTGDGSRKEKGISFCGEFSHGGGCDLGDFRGSAYREIPAPERGYWDAKLTFRANSGDTIGRVAFEVKVPLKTLRKVEAEKPTAAAGGGESDGNATDDKKSSEL